jgi:hypothetical protein
VGLFLFNGDLYNSRYRKFILKFANIANISVKTLVYDTLSTTTNGTTTVTLPIPTLSTLNYDNENDLTGYSTTTVSKTITSQTTKIVNDEWKKRNKLYKKLKNIFVSGYYSVF